MQLLALDGRMGASGDMLLGVLVDAGADPAVLSQVEERLGLRYQIGAVDRSGISATNVQVLVSEREDDHSHESGDAEQDEHEHSHTPGHEHTNDHGDSSADHQHTDSTADHQHTDSRDDDRAHGHTHAEGAGPTRSYQEVIEIVESMALPPAVEADATEIFRLLGEAEASVHGTDLQETHFHEVGADDAIADIVGVALLLHDLDPDSVVTTPLATGGGTVEMSHGTYPIPAPAVVELAAVADWSLRGGPIETELLTPTGAAILAHIADGVERLPTMDIDAVGYGAGNKSFDSHPNVLRALVGEDTDGLTRDQVTVLETNLDDATPEELGGLQETLADVGALDVSILPATMKKSRPGHLVKVIVKPEDADRVARKLAVETGTLGVREHGRGHRLIADREKRTVEVTTSAGSAPVGVKIARIGDEVFDVSAEFDDAQTVAAESDRSVRDVMRSAEARAREAFGIESDRR